MSYNYGNYPPPYNPYGYQPQRGNPGFRADLNAALNLDPLAYHVYGGFQQQPTPGGNNNPYINSYNPISPNYIGDSPLGFAQNVLDPMMAPVTATYRQTAAMIDDSLKNQKK